jgi:peptide/nickel transport system permease protein
MSLRAPDAVVSTAPPRRLAGRGVSSRRSLFRFLAVRLAMLPISVFLIVTVSFFILAVLPGDIPHAILGPLATPTQLASLNAHLGLQHPIAVRYWDYMSGLFHGTLGDSYYTGKPIASEIGSRLPATLAIVVPAVLLALALGVTLGSIGGYFSLRMPDRLARTVLTVVQSVPDFFLGLLLILVFFSILHLLPGPEGQLGFADETPRHLTGQYVLDAALAGDWGVALSGLRHLVLPVVTLGVVYSATFGRTTRALLGVPLNSEYTRFGRACGLSEPRLLWNALLAARTSLLTYASIVIAGILGGDAVVEIVFSWNGVGQWAVQSMLRQDLPAVEGFVVLVGTVAVVTYLLLDLISSLLDPRIRFNVNRSR